MVDNNIHKHHTSQQFDVELGELQTRMLEMGGLAEQQVCEAVDAFMNADSRMAANVRDNDKQINDMEVLIDEECTRILARRQPAASDLRLVLAISKAINDLERVGDEACKIADQAVRLSEEGEMPKGFLEIRHIGNHVSKMMRDALDAFARLDVDQALRVAQEDKVVDLEYGTAMRSLVTYMMEDPRSISAVLSVMWALRSLERVGDHARNLAEHIIFLVKGENVRHVGLQEMAEKVQEASF